MSRSLITTSKHILFAGKYYVTASDSPADMYLEFDTLDDLLDRWMIQGRPLRSILPDIDLEG